MRTLHKSRENERNEAQMLNFIIHLKGDMESEDTGKKTEERNLKKKWTRISKKQTIGSDIEWILM